MKLRNLVPSQHLVLACSAALLISGCVGDKTETSSSQSVSSSAAISSQASSSSAPQVASSSSSEGDIANYDHCLEGFKPHITNGFITDGPTEFDAGGGVKNATVHPTVYEYMYENGWQDAHVLWHNVRACGGFGETPRPDLPNACQDPLFQAEETTCSGHQDGLEFLAGHRLMLEQLKQLWPDHAEQFSGWDKFPSRNDYPEVLRPYFRDWNNSQLTSAEMGDNIDSYLNRFATEGELGTWLQCGGAPGSTGFNFNNLHIDLHSNGSPGMGVEHSVNNNNQNLDAYLFWKLHGWIDNVWENYRQAKGKTRDDEDYKAEMLRQCREMDHWREISVASRNPDGDTDNPGGDTDAPRESGFFHEVVRPAFEDNGCLQCHGDAQIMNDLQLGGNITSTEIVEQLLGNASLVNNWKYVVPGDLNASWLYLKAAGTSQNANVSCTSGVNCRNPMPYQEPVIQALRTWIVDRNAEKPQMTF